jgi:hypothetical protein
MARSTRKLLDVEPKYGMWKLKQPLRPTRYYFGTETKPYRDLSKREYAKALELQAREAVKVHSYNGKTGASRFLGEPCGRQFCKGVASAPCPSS